MADLKLDTFIKVILMTTSDNNSEALAAVRRANVMLKAANTTWEALLRGKVTVVADPFADIPVPHVNKATSRPTTPQAPHQYAPPPPPPPRPTPQPPNYANMGPTANYARTHQRTRNTNTFDGTCFNCDTYVSAGYGAVRDVSQPGGAVAKIFCEDCNDMLARGIMTMTSCINRHNSRNSRKSYKTAAPQPRAKRKVTTKDLMSDIFDDTAP